MTSVAIRDAGTRDWPFIERLLTGANLPVEDLDPGRLGGFLVAEDTATPPQVCGLIGLQVCGAAGLLRSLVVSDDCRGSGVGRQLVGAIEERARAAGVTDLWLLTNDAEVFFWKLDYRIAERDEAPDAIRATKEFTHLCPGSAHLMHKAL